MAADDHHHSHLDDEERTRVERIWHAHLTGGTELLDPRMRAIESIFKRLPSDPRCMLCQTPFKGVGGMLARALGNGIGSSSRLNPRICARCERFARHYEVGTELDVALLFADVRGSTRLAEDLGPAEFHRLIDRFYRAVTGVLVEHNALIEKIIGDEVTGVFVPGIAGDGYPRRAVDAALAVLQATGHAGPTGPWIPVGVGVHSGPAYVGSVGSTASVSDIVVLGDTPNATARITSQAAPGEVLVSAAAAAAAHLDVAPHQARELVLKGRSEPMTVYVLRVAP